MTNDEEILKRGALSRLKRAKEILQAWSNKQGHDKCHYYPEVFRELCILLGVRSPLPVLPPKEEFIRGCQAYQEELYEDRHLG